MINLYKSKLNPFGNYDDEPPEGVSWLKWLIRNPLHNFAFYWIGLAGRITYREGSMWKEGFSLSWVSSSSLRLPLVSWRGDKIEGYVGWRPNGGFGISIRKAKSKQLYL